MPARRAAPSPRPLAASLALLAILAAPALAAPPQFLPVDDPVMAEVRILDLYAPPPGAGRVRLPHLDAGPLQAQELLPMPRGDYRAWLEVPTGPRGIAVRRVLRALSRDATLQVSPDPFAWPRLWSAAWPGEGLRVECSAGAEAARDWTRDGADPSLPARWRDGSGLHLRTGIQVDRWFLYSHVFLGELHDVAAFSDALVHGTDVAASTEESYVAYGDASRWSAQLGRDRWHWGPGEDGSLLLSRTAAPLTGLMLHARVEPLAADAFVFSATTDPGRGEQLAAHRLEWQPRPAVRLGLAEAARYHAGGWQGLYVAGVLPYAMVQKLLDQDHPDSAGVLRNNVMVAADASVRVADGSRVYGEVLVDDLHARTAQVPNKFAARAGWSGTGVAEGWRLAWNVEFAWLSRYVYTSYFGRAFTAQDRPIGYPTGPGSRRWRAGVTLDPCTDWQFALLATRVESGTEGVSDPFLPGGPVPDVATLAGPVETARSLAATARWWPSGGVDASLTLARETADGAAHVAGASRSGWRASAALRLVR
jgi:hypothetical protein